MLHPVNHFCWIEKAQAKRRLCDSPINTNVGAIERGGGGKGREVEVRKQRKNLKKKGIFRE